MAYVQLSNDLHRILKKLAAQRRTSIFALVDEAVATLLGVEHVVAPSIDSPETPAARIEAYLHRQPRQRAYFREAYRALHLGAAEARRGAEQLIDAGRCTRDRAWRGHSKPSLQLVASVAVPKTDNAQVKTLTEP